MELEVLVDHTEVEAVPVMMILVVVALLALRV
jgi:hypothetical protein